MTNSCKNKSKHLTQAEQLAKALLEISVDVTTADRKALIETKKVSKATVSTYLSGVVSDNDTAALILSFLKKRIAKRFEVLNQ